LAHFPSLFCWPMKLRSQHFTRQLTDVERRPSSNTLISQPRKQLRSLGQASKSRQFPTLASARSGLRLRTSVVLTIKTNGLEREFNFDRATKSSELQYKTNPRWVEIVVVYVRVFTLTFSASRCNNYSSRHLPQADTRKFSMRTYCISIPQALLYVRLITFCSIFRASRSNLIFKDPSVTLPIM